MTAPAPEAWLRGDVEGIAPPIQPAAHGFIQAREEVEHALHDMPADWIWAPLPGAASLGFHCRHLAQSTGRLITYAGGGELSESQRRALESEKRIPSPLPDSAELGRLVSGAIDAALAFLRTLDERALPEPRAVGRARLPSTVGGIVFHAAQHAARHAGQATTTARVIRSLRAAESAASAAAAAAAAAVAPAHEPIGDPRVSG